MIDFQNESPKLITKDGKHLIFMPNGDEIKGITETVVSQNAEEAGMRIARATVEFFVYVEDGKL